jgi:hypothetical protein
MLFLVLFGLPVAGFSSLMKTFCGGQKKLMPPRCRMFFYPTQDKNTKPVFQMWIAL